MVKRTFRSYSVQAFVALLRQQALGKVRFSEVHVHHTYRPTRADYDKQSNKEELIRGMWRYHTETRGFQDIAQHATIDPEGRIWDGRPFDKPPASATGYNDSDDDGVHPFMFEMIGNFDIGHDQLDGAQLQAAIDLTAAVLDLWQLSPANIRFHREMAAKTCPGSSVDKAIFVGQVEAALQAGRQAADAGAMPVIDSAVAIVLSPGSRLPERPDSGQILDGWLIGGTAYAPVRQLARALDHEARWDAANKSVIIRKADDSRV